MRSYKDIPSYIKAAPKASQAALRKLRSTIRKAAPKATEAISYGIPTYKLNGNLVHFGGWEKHVGFYPGSKVIRVFATDLAKYECSKGTVRFPLTKRLPLGLITKIVKFRVKESTKA